MEKRIALCFITSTLLVTSSVMFAMDTDGSEETVFMSKDDSTVSNSKFLDKASNSSSGSNSPHNSTSQSPSPFSSQPSSPSLLRMAEKEKEKRRAQIRRNVAHLADQFEEADAATAALNFLRAGGEPLPTASRSRSGSPSPRSSGSSTPSDSNDEELKRASKEILSKLGASGVETILTPVPLMVRITLDDGTPVANESEAPEPTTPIKSLLELNQQRQREERERIVQQQVPSQTLQQETPIKQPSWFKQHPVCTTLSGIGISLAALILIFYYLDQLPDIGQTFGKFIRTHYSL